MANRAQTPRKSVAYPFGTFAVCARQADHVSCASPALVTGAGQKSFSSFPSLPFREFPSRTRQLAASAQITRATPDTTSPQRFPHGFQGRFEGRRNNHDASSVDEAELLKATNRVRLHQAADGSSSRRRRRDRGDRGRNPRFRLRIALSQAARTHTTAPEQRSRTSVCRATLIMSPCGLVKNVP